MTVQISLQAARQLLLASQGLLTPPARTARKADVLTAIRRMELLQIDTISVVARSPYFVLYSRVGGYEQRWLDELLAEGRIFEYWAHAACFVPAEDYPLYASIIEHGRKHGFGYWPRRQAWGKKHKREVDHVRRRIAAEGALRSSDFENTTGKRGPWWDWKIEKAALEYLFIIGELMIARRDKFQRVYDLRERVMPGWNSSQLLPLDDVYRRMTSNAARALGVATEPWLRDYYRLHHKNSRQAVNELVESGELLQAQLEGSTVPVYIHRDSLPLLRKAERGKLDSTRTAFFSPFDPVVWHRDRASGLFGFDYRIECYTLEHKRRYGYFTLPVLHNGALIGRIDPKAHRRDGIFEVKALHLEPGVSLSADDWCAIAGELQRLADWHGTPEVTVVKSDSAGSAAQLRKALKATAKPGSKVTAAV